MVELVIDRFVWQRQDDGTYKWDVKLIRRVEDPGEPGTFLERRFDAMSPDMAGEAFGFVKEDVQKVVNPFLLADAGAARARLAEVQAELAAVTGAAKATEARLRAELRTAGEEAEGLRAEIEALTAKPKGKAGA